MFLKEKSSGEMIEVLAINDLFDPFLLEVVGRFQHGEEVGDPETFQKTGLLFLSGEALPGCWTDSHYRDAELRRA